MKWLLQKNIWGEYAYDGFIQSIKDAGIELHEVNVIPFTTELVPEINFIPDQIFGSGRFVNICRERGFNTFKSFNPIEGDIYNDPDIWVNGNCWYALWGKIKNETFFEPTFLKPMTEKFFTGKVIEVDVKIGDQLQLATSFIEDEDSELVQLSPVRHIKEEVRFYIIGGQVVSGSVYKSKGQNVQYRVESYDDSFVACVDIIKKYGCIDDAFVMDLGLVDGKWKIVELNNINSSGLYKTDTYAIVRAFKLLTFPTK